MTKANKDGWKRVWGRACPAEAIGAIIDVRLRSGAIETNAPADTWNWERTRHPLEVMAWRLHSIEAKQAPKFDLVALRDEVKSLRSAIVAHQAGISKITARIEEIEIELDKEGFALVDKQVEKQALPDMDDPANWRVGDMFEIVDQDESGGHEFNNGEVVRYLGCNGSIDDHKWKMEYEDGRDFWWVRFQDVKPLSRP